MGDKRSLIFDNDQKRGGYLIIYNGHKWECPTFIMTQKIEGEYFIVSNGRKRGVPHFEVISPLSLPWRSFGRPLYLKTLP